MLKADNLIQSGYVVTMLVKNGLNEYGVQKAFDMPITATEIQETLKELKKQLNNG